MGWGGLSCPGQGFFIHGGGGGGGGRRVGGGAEGYANSESRDQLVCTRSMIRSP